MASGAHRCPKGMRCLSNTKCRLDLFQVTSNMNTELPLNPLNPIKPLLEDCNFLQDLLRPTIDASNLRGDSPLQLLDFVDHLFHHHSVDALGKGIPDGFHYLVEVAFKEFRRLGSIVIAEHLQDLDAKLFLIGEGVSIVKRLVTINNRAFMGGEVCGGLSFIPRDCPLEMGAYVLDDKAALVSVGVDLGIVHEGPSDIKAIIRGRHGEESMECK